MRMTKLKIFSVFIVVALLAIRFWPEKPHVIYEPPADYVERTKAYNVPPFPEGWTFDYYTAEDGTKIRWGQTARKDNAKGTLIFIPGYTSTLEMAGDVFLQLSNRGYHVMGYDIRGQGGSDRHRPEQPEKLYVKDFSVYGDDLNGFVKSLPEDIPRPLMIMGSSLGGAVATRGVGDHDMAVEGLVLLAPAYQPLTAPYSIGQIKLMGGLAKLFGKEKYFALGLGPWRPDGLDLTQPSDCSSYPERLYLRDVNYVRHPALRVGDVTPNFLGEMIENGEIVTDSRYAAKLNVPITMIVADVDVIINSPVSEAACTDIFPDCKLVELPGTGHCLTLEDDTVFAAMWDEVDRLHARLTLE